MEHRIAIIGAMDEEVTTLSQSLNQKAAQKTPFNDLPLWTGRLWDRAVLIARSGIGKVNAAMTTQYIIDHYKPSLIINTGVAGGISSTLKIGDLVVGYSSLQHDFDTRNFGYPRGVIPRLQASVFTADPRVVNVALEVAKGIFGTSNVQQGVIVSGDQFVSSLAQKEEILHFFPEASCVEMEGAAIAHVASLNQIPHLIVRAISDQADNTAPADFDLYLKEIIPPLNSVILELVKTLEI